MPEAELKPRRVCLFGGTFDPIHCAHLAVAVRAASRFAFDEVVFIPAGNPPHKQGMRVTPYLDRLTMVEIACSPYAQFRVSRIEESSQRSYTIDTVLLFKQSIEPGTELFFLIGADAFKEIKTWHRWRELIALIAFVVVTRPGESYDIPAEANVISLEGLELAVSSSTIRAELAAGEATPDVPSDVRLFIEERGLYRDNPILRPVR